MISLIVVQGLILGFGKSAYSVGIPSRILGSGIVFPALDSAITEGPQTLSFSPDEVALGITSSLSSYPTVTGKFAHAAKDFSYGFGYSAINPTQAYYYTASPYEHWAYLAADYRYSKLSLGATIGANLASSYGISPQVSFGIGFGGIAGTNFVIFLPNILSIAPQIGIGYIDPERYSLEFNVLLPSLASIGSYSSLGLSVGVTTYVGTFGLSFSATNSLNFSSLSLSPSYTLGGSFRFSKKIGLRALINSSYTLSAGVVFGF